MEWKIGLTAKALWVVSVALLAGLAFQNMTGVQVYHQRPVVRLEVAR